jgi:hypothetical protein
LIRGGRIAVVTVGLLLAVTAGSGAEAIAPQSGGLPEDGEPFALDPARFTVQIDNPYWPMEPGTRWTFRETDAEGSQRTVVVTVTSRTKEIANGITARVVRDTVTEKGAVLEDTFDWYAQDDVGNIWYLGERTAEFAHGKVTSRHGSFEAGVKGAMAGVVVPATPVAGLRYRQEYYAGEAEDRAEVLGVDEQVEVAAGHFEHALMTKETTPLEPKVLELKFYARNIGPALAVAVSGGSDREELLQKKRVSSRVAAAAGVAPLGSRYP